MCYHAHKGPVRFILPVSPIRRPIVHEHPTEDTPPREDDPQQQNTSTTHLQLLPPPPGHHAAASCEMQHAQDIHDTEHAHDPQHAHDPRLTHDPQDAGANPEVSTSYEGIADSRESLGSNARMVRP